MLSYDNNGTGVPLVFLHAFPLSRQMWTNVQDKLGKHYRVIAVDLQGFGGSVQSKDVTTMEEMAREALLTLDSLQLKEKFVLCGVSMGGYVMFQILKQAAGRLRGMVFVSTRSTPDNEETRERRKKTIEMVREHGTPMLADKMISNLLGKTSLATRSTVVEDVKKMISAASADGVCAALRGMAIRPDSTQFLQTINVPTLVLSGEEDTFVLPSEMGQMARLIPRARFESIPQAGHLIPLEQPDLFVDTFEKYLKRSIF